MASNEEIAAPAPDTDRVRYGGLKKAASGSKNKKIRSYRFDASVLEEIELLKRSLNLDNNSDVLRKALTLLRVVSTAIEQDGSVVIRAKDGDKEIIFI